MRRLAVEYHRVRRKAPERKIMIVFDIDGTILDNRYVVDFVLKAHDRSHGTHYFDGLKLESIDFHEDDPHPVFERCGVPEAEREKIFHWYREHRWQRPYLLAAHHPYRGVLEVIRWFSIQPNTFVGLNTGRPEPLRNDTLRSLNELGKEFRVQFSSDRLFMGKGGWGKDIMEGKVQGIFHFEKKGYYVFAFIDNEPENLKAVAEAKLGHRILLLHADTIFQSSARHIPEETVGGNDYDLISLMAEENLPQHIQFVWRGVDSTVGLSQFLKSQVHWAELDIRQDPATGLLIIRRESLWEKPQEKGEEVLSLEPILEGLFSVGRGVKFHLREGGGVLQKLQELIQKKGFPQDCLWFHGSLPIFGEEGIASLSQSFPLSIRECPIGFLAPLILGAQQQAKETMAMLNKWGVNRFGLDWMTPDRGKILERLEAWGYAMDIENVFDLEAFLQAVLHLPKSITSEFLMTEWPMLVEAKEKKGSIFLCPPRA